MSPQLLLFPCIFPDSNPCKLLILLHKMAEREGFEPSQELPPNWFSRPALSTTQSPLLYVIFSAHLHSSKAISKFQEYLVLIFSISLFSIQHFFSNFVILRYPRCLNRGTVQVSQTTRWVSPNDYTDGEKDHQSWIWVSKHFQQDEGVFYPHTI